MRMKRHAILGMIAPVMLLAPLSYAQGPVFKVTPLTSMIKFNVSASVPIAGNFDKWTATLKFPSADVTSGQLDIQISAATVNTGSGMKNDKLKSKDFFDVAQNPYITFKSTKVVQTGPTTFDEAQQLVR
jgi:polyisoprenoid-binding protein YceI